MSTHLYKIVGLFLLAPVFVACSSSGESFEALMERLEFGCGEVGEVSISTQLDIDPSVVARSNTSVIYTKKKEDPDAGCEAPVNE